MLNCYIDPIFLAIKNSVSSKNYSENVFLTFNDFFNRLKDLEKDYGDVFIKFNLTQDLIHYCMNFSPFQFESPSIRKRFKGFLFQILRKYRNINCNILSDLDTCTSNFHYENQHIPAEIMDIWNKFLNSCSTCSSCKDKNLELLTSESLGSIKNADSEEFFNSYLKNLIQWLDERFAELLEDLDFNIPEIDLPRFSKRKGDWNHYKAKLVIREANKLLDCKYIREVRPIEKTQGINHNLIKYEDINVIRIHIKDNMGTVIFILITTARREAQNRAIMEHIRNIIPHLN